MEVLKNDNEERRINIEKQETYLLNHWSAIKNAFHVVQMPCSMESAISHYIASIFTSGPKGYTLTNLEKYINYRQHYLNGYNLEELYLKSLGKEVEKETINITKEEYDFSIFEPRQE